jgi:hypothetical protein
MIIMLYAFSGRCMNKPHIFVSNFGAEAERNFAPDKICALINRKENIKAPPFPGQETFRNFWSLKRCGDTQQNISESYRWERL